MTSTATGALERDARFAEALSRAIERQPLTLDQIATQLTAAGAPVSVASLSYWQRGRSLPTRERSLVAIAELERILRVPVGHLSSALPNDAFERWDHIKSVPLPDRADAALELMGIDLNGTLPRYMHDEVLISEDPRWRTETNRDISEVLLDGIDRTAALFVFEADVMPTPVITTAEGSRLGRVVELEEHHMLIVELLFLQGLSKGDLHMGKFAMEWFIEGDTRWGNTQRILPRSASHLVLEAAFEGSAPVSARYMTTPYDASADPRSRRLVQDLPAGEHLQICLSDPPPGWHCLEWEMEEGAADA